MEFLPGAPEYGSGRIASGWLSVVFLGQSGDPVQAGGTIFEEAFAIPVVESMFQLPWKRCT